jgi:hypothetical protein
VGRALITLCFVSESRNSWFRRPTVAPNVITKSVNASRRPGLPDDRAQVLNLLLDHRARRRNLKGQYIMQSGQSAMHCIGIGIWHKQSRGRIQGLPISSGLGKWLARHALTIPPLLVTAHDSRLCFCSSTVPQIQDTLGSWNKMSQNPSSNGQGVLATSPHFDFLAR